MPQGVLALAIGDVSGKGVPASLLMANVNSLVYAASSVNRYATFFYAQYEPDRRLLTYVNAGHNPPILLRRNVDVARLEAGGPPAGLLYRETGQHRDRTVSSRR